MLNCLLLPIFTLSITNRRWNKVVLYEEAAHFSTPQPEIMNCPTSIAARLSATFGAIKWIKAFLLPFFLVPYFSFAFYAAILQPSSYNLTNDEATHSECGTTDILSEHKPRELKRFQFMGWPRTLSARNLAHKSFELLWVTSFRFFYFSASCWRGLAT